jgi:hypothetical protein
MVKIVPQTNFKNPTNKFGGGAQAFGHDRKSSVKAENKKSI